MDINRKKAQKNAILGWMSLIGLLAILWTVFGEDPRLNQGARGGLLLPELASPANQDSIVKIRFEKAGAAIEVARADSDSLWYVAKLEAAPAAQKQIMGLDGIKGQTQAAESFDEKAQAAPEAINKEASKTALPPATRPLARLEEEALPLEGFAYRGDGGVDKMALDHFVQMIIRSERREPAALWGRDMTALGLKPQPGLKSGWGENSGSATEMVRLVFDTAHQKQVTLWVGKRQTGSEGRSLTYVYKGGDSRAWLVSDIAAIAIGGMSEPLIGQAALSKIRPECDFLPQSDEKSQSPQRPFLQINGQDILKYPLCAAPIF